MKITFKEGGRRRTIMSDHAFLSCLIADGKGSYFSQGAEKNHTFYQGFLSQYPQSDGGWTMFKFLERLEPDYNIDEIIKEGDSITFAGNRKKTRLSFKGERLLAVDASDPLTLYSDPRKIYDFSTGGRCFSIAEEDGLLIVTYTKGETDKPYSLYLAIKGYTTYKQIDEWIERDYAFDAHRSGRGSWHVHKTLTFTPTNDTLIAQHHDKKKLKELFSSTSQKTEDMKPLLPQKAFDDDEAGIAYASSVKALEDLVIDNRGIYAGYYWFFQFWARDESISLGGLIREQRTDAVKNVVTRLLDSITEDGRIPNRFPHAALGSADGIGWTAKRFGDAIHMFTEDERKEIASRLETAAQRLITHHTEDGFAINAPKETWMDTTGSTTDVRSGARIEMQALRLNLYRLLHEITEKKEYAEREAELRSNVREAFFHHGILADGVVPQEHEWTRDLTIRPNIFLAYCIYPGILRNEEWEEAFDHALEKLWLDWGGLCTIAKDHEWFKDEYTGENDESYHRGDSWFFVNHLAALAMHQLNSEKYKERISKILDASKKEILTQGIIGGNAEVSSAKELRSEGTWQQAWSSATFIELCHELFFKN
ncbi:MAG: amylo-alpha-1,6-glucosidase [Nanoarchaeota archaeon]